MAIEPISRSGPARMKLSLAAYSFRQYMTVSNHGQPPHNSLDHYITMFDFIDYCSNLGIPGAELTSYYFEDTRKDYCLRLKRHAFLRGITISGTAVGNNFCLPRGERRDHELQMVKDWIDRAQLMGAPHIRIFAGERGNLSNEEAKRLCIQGIQECCDYAAEKGVMLGLENHGGIVAEAGNLLDIVHAVNSPWFGVNLDTGNFHTDDPYGDLEKCAPYAVNVQFKVEVQPRGQSKRMADFGRIIRILQQARYQGFVALEHEADEDPWTTIPDYLKRLDELIHG